MPRVYSYQAVTKMFTGEAEALPSPAEEGVWLLPAFATFQAPPPIPSGKTALWQTDHWVIVNMPPVVLEQTIFGWLATDEEKKLVLLKLVADHMDNAARALGFSNMTDAVSSAPNTPTNQAGLDATNLKAWKLGVLSQIYKIIATVQGNHNPMPAISDILASLPRFTRIFMTVDMAPGRLHPPIEPVPPVTPTQPPAVIPPLKRYPVTPPD